MSRIATSPKARCDMSEPKKAGPMRFFGLLEQEWDLDRMLTFDVERQMSGRFIRADGCRSSGLGHRECYGARRSIVAHWSGWLQLQKECLAPLAYFIRTPGRRYGRFVLYTRPVHAPIAALP